MQAAIGESDAVSSVDSGDALPSSAAAGAWVADSRGRHRMQAELKRAEQELKFLQEEFGKLEEAENVSAICKELLRYIDSRADPLLPVTNGTADPLWDRWFEGLHESQPCSCSIL